MKPACCLDLARATRSPLEGFHGAASTAAPHSSVAFQL